MPGESKKKYIDVKSLLKNEILEEETLKKLKNIAHYLVINDKDIDEKSMKLLEKLLKDNPEHIIHLDVGDKFVDKYGALSIGPLDLPKNIKHFKISNAKGNVTTIKGFFLPKTLTSTDMSGFENLKTIAVCFPF